MIFQIHGLIMVSMGNMVLTCIGDMAQEEPKGIIAQTMIMIIFTEGVPRYEGGIGDRILVLVCLSGVGGGRYSLDTVNVEAIMTHHMSGPKANTKVGIWF